MKSGHCDAEVGSIYLDTLMHLGRIADMCSNIGIHTLARHTSGVENFEHSYMNHLRRGENEYFNTKYEQLCKEYGIS